MVCFLIRLGWVPQGLQREQCLVRCVDPLSTASPVYFMDMAACSWVRSKGTDLEPWQIVMHSKGFIQIIDVVLKFGPTLRTVIRVAPDFRYGENGCLYRVCNSMPLSDSFRYDTMVILSLFVPSFSGFAQFFILIAVPTRLATTYCTEYHCIGMDLASNYRSIPMVYPIAHLSSRASILTSHPAQVQ